MKLYVVSDHSKTEDSSHISACIRCVGFMRLVNEIWVGKYNISKKVKDKRVLLCIIQKVWGLCNLLSKNVY